MQFKKHNLFIQVYLTRHILCQYVNPKLILCTRQKNIKLN
jgi:hypothetical protein